MRYHKAVSLSLMISRNVAATPQALTKAPETTRIQAVAAQVEFESKV
jgi:hypothetical protein